MMCIDWRLYVQHLQCSYFTGVITVHIWWFVKTKAMQILYTLVTEKQALIMKASDSFGACPVGTVTTLFGSWLASSRS